MIRPPVRPDARRAGVPSCHEIAHALDHLLNISRISDSAQNGLQVAGKRPVRMVAVAVDASLETFRLACEAGTDLLVVHHGLFWGKCEPVTGPLYARLAMLMESGMGLYASHLPLDLHPKLGNNSLLARGLGLKQIQPFGTYHGQKIGFGGELSKPATIGLMSQRLTQITHTLARSLEFGPKLIRKVAVVSGGAGDLVKEAAQEGYDAFVTGELIHENYHICRESGIHFLAGGHYATETLGVKAVAQFLKKHYQLSTFFIDFPTEL